MVLIVGECDAAARAGMVLARVASMGFPLFYLLLYVDKNLKFSYPFENLYCMTANHTRTQLVEIVLYLIIHSSKMKPMWVVPINQTGWQNER